MGGGKKKKSEESQRDPHTVENALEIAHRLINLTTPNSYVLTWNETLIICLFTLLLTWFDSHLFCLRVRQDPLSSPAPPGWRHRGLKQAERF